MVEIDIFIRLMEQLEETMAGGHKALGFSPFVSFLTVVHHRLDKAGITYEYTRRPDERPPGPCRAFSNRCGVPTVSH